MPPLLINTSKLIILINKSLLHNSHNNRFFKKNLDKSLFQNTFEENLNFKTLKYGALKDNYINLML
jgi:hypothetical protein